MIPFGKPLLGDAERRAAAEVLEGTTLTHGPRVREFESAFADYTGAPHAVATATCAAALHLAYLFLEIGEGDEVIVPAQTHVAQAHAVEVCGATPVFLDAEARTGNVDLDQLEGLIGPRTRAISIVHYLGLPVDMERVLEVARRHELFVVEDCAIALGATIGGRHVGLHGDVGCFSFYPVKHITTGEGGMLVTTRDDVAERVSKQRAFGIDKSVLADRRHTAAYDVELLGLNYRLGEMGAAIGIEQIGRLPEFLAARERNFTALAEGLEGVDGIDVLASGHDGERRSSHYCLVGVLDAPLAERREDVIEALKAEGVGTSVYYPVPPPNTSYYRATYGDRSDSYPVASRISSDSIALPVGPHVSEADVDTMIGAVGRVLSGWARVHRLAGKRVALVGGAGFIGHRLALALSDQGAKVDVLDGLEVNHLLDYQRLAPGATNRELYLRILRQRLEFLDAAGVPLHVIDARDYHGLSRVLSEVEPQVVVHLAAVAHAGRSNKDPYSTFDHSLRTLENSLDYARGNAEHFVYFSSSMVYGNFRTSEVAEDHPLDPMGIYGALKLAGEKLVIGYQQVFDLPYTIVRPSALYGPGCVSRRVGQIFIESALVGDKLRVDGEGDERLDFSYIDDVVDGIARIIAEPASHNEAFNITAGRSRALKELIAIVQEHFPEVEVEYVARDALRPYRGTLDISKARRLIGFEPSTTLEDGLDRYVEWYRDLTSNRAATRAPAG